VVTANKALLALHGNEIFAAAQEKGVMVAFEAAVAGGVPIIKALREGLTANRIESVAGIINGTTNFILSEMREKGLDFDHVLAVGDRAQHQLARQLVAADQFHHDVDLRMLDHRERVAHHLDIAAHHAARTLEVTGGHHRNLDAAPGAAANVFLVALKDVEGARTHGAYA
jgi:hypothetical protein